MSNSESPKKIESLTLENFTVFENATFEFCPGINVLIGENSTGKTHVLKVLYSYLKTSSKKEEFSKILSQSPKDYSKKAVDMTAYMFTLSSVFNPSKDKIIFQNLVRFPEHAREIHLKLDFKSLETELFSLEIIPFFEHREQQGDAEISAVEFKGSGLVPENVSSLYIPADEFLSKNEGFLS